MLDTTEYEGGPTTSQEQQGYASRPLRPRLLRLHHCILHRVCVKVILSNIIQSQRSSVICIVGFGARYILEGAVVRDGHVLHLVVPKSEFDEFVQEPGAHDLDSPARTWCVDVTMNKYMPADIRGRKKKDITMTREDSRIQAHDDDSKDDQPEHIKHTTLFSNEHISFAFSASRSRCLCNAAANSGLASAITLVLSSSDKDAVAWSSDMALCG